MKNAPHFHTLPTASINFYSIQALSFIPYFNNKFNDIGKSLTLHFAHDIKVELNRSFENF